MSWVLSGDRVHRGAARKHKHCCAIQGGRTEKEAAAGSHVCARKQAGILDSESIGIHQGPALPHSRMTLRPGPMASCPGGSEGLLRCPRAIHAFNVRRAANGPSNVHVRAKVGSERACCVHLERGRVAGLQGLDL